jgi:signal transduction histidine kinase
METASSWSSKTLLRYHVSVLILFCCLFVALFYETPFFGPVLNLNKLAFRVTALSITLALVCMFAVERRIISIYQLRSVSTIVIPATQQAMMTFQMNNEFLENSLAERFLAVMSLQNPLPILASSWFLGPTMTHSIIGMSIVFGSFIANSIDQWMRCVVPSQCYLIQTSALMNFLYMTVVASLLWATQNVIQKLIAGADSSRLAREAFLNRMSHDLRSPLAAVIGNENRGFLFV